MPTRIIPLVLVVLGVASQASAEIICETVNHIAREVKRRQCWPDPFNAPDRAAARSPYAIQVANGWRRQNMLGEFHFESGTGELSEAGRLKVRWILLTGPQQHRLIYIHAAERPEETAARLAAVQQLASKIAPENIPPIMTTSISDEGWPAEQVDVIGRKYQATMPAPRLPEKKDGDGSGG